MLNITCFFYLGHITYFSVGELPKTDRFKHAGHHYEVFIAEDFRNKDLNWYVVTDKNNHSLMSVMECEAL